MNKYMQAVQTDRQKTIQYASCVLLDEPQDVATNRIELGIAEIRTLVGEVLEHESAGRLSPTLAKAYKVLVSNRIEESLAMDILQSLKVPPTIEYDALKLLLIEEMIRRLPQSAPPPSRDVANPTVIALVGPTGVGKTTTIAKLATKFRLQQGRNVTLITADTYRVAAVDQLQQYADLIDTPLLIAGTAIQMKESIATCTTSDIVLIDTAGRSAADTDRIEETAKILEAANPTEIHLVLSSASSLTATKRAAERFSVTGYNRVITTKVDEAVTMGEVYSTLCTLRSSLSWVTNGQDVASHIDLAKPEKLVHSFFDI
jgi:flagellar biosynthesis protein FlhF